MRHPSLLLSAVFCLTLSTTAHCDTFAYVPSPDEGIVYRVSLEQRSVSARINTGGSPWYALKFEDFLLLDGPDEKSGHSYIQVFDLQNNRTLRRWSAGSICCTLLHDGTVVYAITDPIPQLTIVNLRDLSVRVVTLPHDFLPVAIERGDRNELLLAATQYASPGIAKTSLLYRISIPTGEILTTAKLPTGVTMLTRANGRIFVSSLGASPEYSFFRSDSVTDPNWTQFAIPFFCEQFSNRQKYAFSPYSQELIIAAGDCPGGQELETKEPTITGINMQGTVVWSVTDKADRVPSPNSIAIAPDGTVAFVSGGWGFGLLDPKTHKLKAQIALGKNLSFWGLYVESQTAK